MKKARLSTFFQPPGTQKPDEPNIVHLDDYFAAPAGPAGHVAIVQMAAVPILAEGGKVPPTFLDRAIRRKIRDEQKQQLLHICRELIKRTGDFFLDPDLIPHPGGNNLQVTKKYLSAIVSSTAFK